MRSSSAKRAGRRQMMACRSLEILPALMPLASTTRGLPWPASAAHPLPIVAADPSLREDTPGQRPVDVSSMWIRDGELYAGQGMAHGFMPSAGKRPVPAEFPQATDELTPTDGFWHAVRSC